MIGLLFRLQTFKLAVYRREKHVKSERGEDWKIKNILEKIDPKKGNKKQDLTFVSGVK